MNPFVNTEFWLGLAFFIVLGMVIFSPIRQVIQKSIRRQKEQIQEKIDQSNAVYKEALELHKKTLKDFKNSPQDQTLHDQIQTIKKEFSETEKTQIENKNQNFQIQKMLFIAQTKQHLRTQLLQKVQDKVLAGKTHPNSLSQEIKHFVKVLHENKDLLDQNL